MSGTGAGDAVVRAAGAVVHRRRNGRIEVAVVHRPRYDDWSFPKGKAEPGESDEDCARREVEEETGLRGRLGPELPSTRYVDRRGRPKVVRYWQMTADSGSFTATDEVDEIRWVSIGEGVRLLTYAHDRVLLMAVGGVSGPPSSATPTPD